MTIRWRLIALLLQTLVLGAATYRATGAVVSGEIWFFSGLLAIAINPLLLEPFYPKPQDVLGNAMIASALALAAPKTSTRPGWTVLVVFLSVVGLSALLAILLGAGRKETASSTIAKGFQMLARVGSAAVIYSSIFWLAVLEFAPPRVEIDRVEFPPTFWTLGTAWVVVMIIGRVNWQSIWASVTRSPVPATPDGMIGPSILLLTANSLPPSGTVVGISGGRHEVEGVVITRIQRAGDAWAEVYVDDSDVCSELVRKPALKVESRKRSLRHVIGSVDSGSTDRKLEFTTTEPLTIGEVVTVKENGHDVLYQIATAEIERSAIRGGTHLIVRARAIQLGEFDAATGRISRHQWVPSAGNAVERGAASPRQGMVRPTSWTLMGYVLGTAVPVYMDLDAICEGHLAILGMTRMGKTTFAARLAHALGERRAVIILDQSGEYVGKRGLKPFQPGDEHLPGPSVFEPKPGEVAPNRARKCLEWLVDVATAEYKTGEPPKRVLIIEEAHQFIPEPAGLGFNAPGRDDSYAFGLLMMQIRKYGLSAVLISQRTAVVAKSALSQCENVIAFKSVDQTGLDYLEAIVGSEARLILPSLKQGQALVFGPAVSADGPVVVEMLKPDLSLSSSHQDEIDRDDTGDHSNSLS